MILGWDRPSIIGATSIVILSGAAVITTQPTSVAYLAIGLSSGITLLLATLLHRQRHLATSNVQSDKARMPLLLLLWITLIGFAIDEDLTFGARTSASDYVLPFLTLSALWLVRKQNMPFIPPRVKPWM